MKPVILFLFCICCCQSFCQNFQLHYDVRHSINSKRNTKNFPSVYFEYFKSQDSGKAFIKPGSFLLKMQADYLGENGNMGKFYMQVSQSFRCWRPKVFLSLQYSGGLGITEPKQYSYYITNTFSAGLEHPFKWGSAYLSSVLYYRYVQYDKPSNDVLFTQYWWQGIWHYKAEFAGDFSVWTENKNRGDDFTKDMHGKRFSFFAEPQFWYNVTKTFAFGIKANMYYHVLTNDNVLQLYPAIAIKCKL